MSVDSFIQAEAIRTGVSKDSIRESVHVLSQMNPMKVSDVELEMLIMHIAYLVDNKNAFDNNWNVIESRRPLFITHSSYAISSDPAAWCRKLNEYNFFTCSSTVSNLMFNWLKGSLDSPESIF